MSNKNDFFFELEQRRKTMDSISNQINSLIDLDIYNPTEETNKLLKEQTDKIQNLIFQQDVQIRLALQDAKEAKRQAKLSSCIAWVSIAVTIVIGLLQLYLGS